LFWNYAIKHVENYFHVSLYTDIYYTVIQSEINRDQ